MKAAYTTENHGRLVQLPHQMDLSQEDQRWLEDYDSETSRLVDDLTNGPPIAAEIQAKHDELEADLKNYEGQRGRCSCGALNKKHRKSNSTVCTRGKAGCKGKSSKYYRRFGYTVGPTVRRMKTLMSACKTLLSEIEKDAASEEA